MDAVDYSYERPSPASIAAAGYGGVIRYLSNEPGKNLSVAERDALFAAGLRIGLVWETTASRALLGDAAGRADAAEANRQADALNHPRWRPLIYAVDFAPRTDQLDAIRAYFRGALAVSTRPVGVYGAYDVLEALAVDPGLACYWQCAAWSGKGSGSGGSLFVPDYGNQVRLSRHACLFQFYGSVRVPGTDHNQGVSDRQDLMWGPDDGEDEMLSDDDRAWLAQAIQDSRRTVELIEREPGEWWEVDGVFRRRVDPGYPGFLARHPFFVTWSTGYIERSTLNARVDEAVSPEQLADLIAERLVGFGAVEVSPTAVADAVAEVFAERLAGEPPAV